MTWDQFLRRVQRNGPWVLRDGYIVQEVDHSNCPWLGAFTQKMRDSEKYERFTRPGRKSIAVADIFDAADNDRGHDPAIRRALLRACKLIVDQPDEDQIQALAALQASWDDEDAPDASDVEPQP